MAKVIFEKVGKMHGVDVYAAIDAESVKAINGRDIMVAEVKGSKATRSTLQNASIYLYMTQLATALNDAGWDMTAALGAIGANISIPWGKESILERLWRPTQKHTFGSDSTTKLEPGHVSVVYEALNRVTSDKLGVGIPFPDKFMKMYEADNARINESR